MMKDDCEKCKFHCRHKDWFLLKQLMLIIKQCLKLLYAFSLSLQNKIMFFTGQSLKVVRAVIIFYSVQVVDKPTFRQWLTVRFLPYQKVFQNIADFICSWMFWLFNYNIALRGMRSSPFPGWMGFAPHSFALAGIASRGIGGNFFTTINAMPKFWRVLGTPKSPYFLWGTRITSQGTTITQFPAICARVLVRLAMYPHTLSHSTLFLIRGHLGSFTCIYHTLSIPYPSLFVKENV